MDFRCSGFQVAAGLKRQPLTVPRLTVTVAALQTPSGRLGVADEARYKCAGAAPAAAGMYMLRVLRFGIMAFNMPVGDLPSLSATGLRSR